MLGLLANIAGGVIKVAGKVGGKVISKIKEKRERKKAKAAAKDAKIADLEALLGGAGAARVSNVFGNNEVSASANSLMAQAQMMDKDTGIDPSKNTQGPGPYGDLMKYAPFVIGAVLLMFFMKGRR